MVAAFKKVASTLFASEVPHSSSSRQSRAKKSPSLELEGGSILSMSPANHENNRPRRPRFSWKWPCHAIAMNASVRHIEIWRQYRKKKARLRHDILRRLLNRRLSTICAAFCRPGLSTCAGECCCRLIPQTSGTSIFRRCFGPIWSRGLAPQSRPPHPPESAYFGLFTMPGVSLLHRKMYQPGAVSRVGIELFGLMWISCIRPTTIYFGPCSDCVKESDQIMPFGRSKGNQNSYYRRTELSYASAFIHALLI